MKDPQGSSVGTLLKQERERKNLTLEAVSQATRISARNLEAIENDDFLSLPAPVFIRSFLKTYAAFVGMNPDKTIAVYETQTGVIGLPPADGFPPEKTRPRKLRLLAAGAVLVLAGAGIYWLVSPRPAPSPSEVAPPPPVPAAPAPAAEAARIPPSPAAALPAEDPPKEGEKSAKPEAEKKPEAKAPPPPPKTQIPSATAPAASSAGAPAEEKKERRHILRVQAKEQTWVRIQADDQPEFEVLLEPQEKAVWTARRQLKITLGNAGGLDMAFNGKRVGPFGTSGQVVHLQFPLPEIKKPGE